MHPFERFRCETMYKMTQHIHSALYYSELHTVQWTVHSYSIWVWDNITQRMFRFVKTVRKEEEGMEREQKKKFIQFTCTFGRFTLLNAISFAWVYLYFPFRLVFRDFLIEIPRPFVYEYHTHSNTFIHTFCSFIVHFYYHLRYESFLCLFLSLCLLDFVMLAGSFSWELFSYNVQRTLFLVIRFRPPSKMKCFFFFGVCVLHGVYIILMLSFILGSVSCMAFFHAFRRKKRSLPHSFSFIVFLDCIFPLSKM